MKRIILLLAVLSFYGTKTSAQWIPQNAGFTNATLGFYEFSIVNQNVVWSICYDGIGGLFGSGRILDFTRTTDGGATWVPGKMGNDTSLAFSNIHALSATEAWVAMHKANFSGGGGLFHTTDGGVTWTQSGVGQIFDNNSFPNFVYFKDAMNGIAGGDANGGYFEIYTTTNGGANWTRTPKAAIPDYPAGDGYGWFDGYAVVGNTVWFGTSTGLMYKSTDFGATWTSHTVSPQGYTVYEIAFNDDGLNGLTNVRTPANTTILFATSDGGVTWTQRAPHPKWKQSRVTSVPGTRTFVSTSVVGGNTGTAYSTDDGLTWTEIDALAKAACRFLNVSTGWGGGFFNDNPPRQLSGGIYKWDPTKPLAVKDAARASYALYPNPAGDKLHVGMPAGSALRFYNVAGMLVKETELPASGDVDIAALPPGAYMIQSKSDPGAMLRFMKQ